MPYMNHVNQLGTNNASAGWQYVSGTDVLLDEADWPATNDLTALPDMVLTGPDKVGSEAVVRNHIFDDSGTGYPSDGLYRTVGESMTGTSGDNYDYAYTLDDVGNRTQVDTASNTFTYSYDTIGLNQLYEVWDTGTIDDAFSYESAGNLEYIMQYNDPSPGGNLYWFSYSPANQLTAIDEYGGTYGPTGSFVYDGLGRLVTKTDAAGHVDHLFYDGSHLAYETRSGTSNAVAYQWAGGMLLSQKQTTATSSHVYWYLEDTHGNVVGLVDGANNNTPVAQYIYDAFGNLLPSSFENQAAMPISNPLRYRGMPGYHYLGEIPGTTTNTQHTFYTAGARTYDAGTGRWLQEDPIVGIRSDPLSFNRYLYCDANPAMNDDPLGLATVQRMGFLDCLNWLMDPDNDPAWRFLQISDLGTGAYFGSFVGGARAGAVAVGVLAGGGGLVRPNQYAGGPISWIICVSIGPVRFVDPGSFEPSRLHDEIWRREGKTIPEN
ncbi:MAG TPA: RHS repeat-associated core domain-containing protein [Armatimonadota bacterium]